MGKSYKSAYAAAYAAAYLSTALPWAAGAALPALVFDFDDEYYRTSGSATTFSNAITHTRASNATMVDSDGVLKWAPHNLLTYSEDLTGADWTDGPGVTTTNSGDYFTLTADAGSSNHWVFNGSPSGQIIVGIEAKAGTASWLSISSSGVPSDGAYFDLASGVKGSENGSDTASIFPLGDGWYYCEVTFFNNESFATFCVHTEDNQSPNWSAVGNETVLVRHPRCIRKGLGGMVDNPDRGDSYVPTTSSAVYLPRRGHHVYNGSTWVNEGILHESESRTNLLTYSEDLTEVSWAENRVLVSDNGDGSFTLTQNATDFAGRLLDNTVTSVAGNTYTWSFDAKAGTANWVFLREAHSDGITRTSWFDVSNGVSGSINNSHSATIKNVGGGFFRCSITFTNNGTNRTAEVSVGLAENDSSVSSSVSFNGSTLIARRPQLEAGSTPSSYIPTSGATATRGAETLTVAAADLPYPTPKVIGPELVTNGTFDTDLTGWTINDPTRGTAVVSGERAVLTNDHALGSTSGFTGIIQPLTTVVGRVYQYQANLGGTAGFSASNNSNGTSAFIVTTGTGDKSVYFVATATTTYIVLYVASGNDAASASFDNISVREIDPLSVSIQMDGRMTYADEGDSQQIKPYFWEADASNKIEMWVDTGGSNTGQPEFRVSASSVTDVVSGDADAYSPGILVPYNISSRHGSTFINGAVDGTALTADNTPTALPDLSATDLQLAYDYMGTIRTFRMWAKDLTDEGIEEATLPSLEPSLSLVFDSSEGSFIVEDWTE